MVFTNLFGGASGNEGLGFRKLHHRFFAIQY